MRIHAGLLAFLLLSAAHGLAEDGTTVTRERVLALTESVGYQIDAAERERYGLFPDTEGFLFAEFLLRDGSYWLRLSYRSAGERTVEQSPLTEAQFLAWREAVLAADRGRASLPVAVLSDTDQRDGRLRLVTDVFLYGLWLYGPATIALFDVDSSRGVTAIELLAGGGAFAGALLKTQDYRLGYARTSLVRWGNYAGTFYGAGVPALLDSGNERVYAVSVMAATPVGGYLAHRWSGHRRFGKGEADLITTGVWVGGLYGLAVPFLAGADEDHGRLYLASAMTGVPAGALLTERVVKGLRINRGRAHLITLGGFMGVAEALSVVDLVDDDAPARAFVWAAALGAPAGAWFGYRLTDGRRHTLGRARMISVGAYAGGLVGQGVAVSLGLGHRARTLSAMIGSTAGLWFTDRLTQDWGEDVTATTGSTGVVRVELPSPAALLTLVIGATHGSDGTNVPPVQLLRLSF
ncbi:MAG TPA: hypothetical protein QGF95_02380 [Candidatus Latescibacteria bacterium]|jgi:hypothetical protein|nr:hypothetical protein [Gemmatimonadaceae bacterium]MDP6018524.1 hypothetical protein [Candidatus Latescibacterota bacterium]HJP29382.1 hypothetical protein [Candidatus Latescibacterota bacterium]